jgi:transcriptional regulator with XRE-family HTH domain
MKKDFTTIKDRIDKLGLTQKHVAEQCKIDRTVLTRMCQGKRFNAERTETIHNYLDLCKTVFKKGKDFK